VSRWRPALRVARRTARRHPGRTALVAALVAAPVLGTAFLSTAYRTASLTADTQVTRAMGAADATVQVTEFARIEPQGTAYAFSDTIRRRTGPAPDPAALLPAGSRLVAVPSSRSVTFTTADRTTVTTGRELDTRDPVTAGLLAVRSGRLAAAAGEVTLSPALARRLGVGIGDEVRPSGAPAARVVGLVADPGCRSCQLAVGLPGWTGTAPEADRPGNADQLVALPAGADPVALRQRLAEVGVLLVPRDARLHPERWGQPADGGGDTTLLAIAVIVAGIGLLEVILLAGTAFAVAARRQVRDSALVLANGGRRSDVRLMLLAQGGVLGALGAATGLVLGVVAVRAAWGPLQRLTNVDFGGLVVSPRDLALTGVVGFAAGVAAAVVPAFGAARVPVVAALAGRYGRPARAHRPAAAAAVVAVAGLVLAGLVAWRWATARRGGDPGGLVYPVGMLVGFGLTMVAMTVLAPSLVGLAGRLAGRLPLTGRLALRDAARHRHRTGPAVGAVMVAVAGAVAVAFAVAAVDRSDRDAYTPELPYGWASAYVTGDPATSSDDPRFTAIRAAAAYLPVAEVVPVAMASVPPAGGRDAGYASWTNDRTGDGCSSSFGSAAIGPAAARLVTGSRAGEAEAALARGRAVLTDPCLLRPDGTAVLQVQAGYDPDQPNVQPPSREVTVPAVLLPGVGGATLPGGVLPAAVATRLGLAPSIGQVVLATTRAPTDAEEDRTRAALGDLASVLQVERGYGAPYLPGFVALMGGAGLVTLAGVAISVSLSAAEGRADLATLAAIGAPPRRRRLLAMAQAALVAGLGVGLGLLLGAAIGTTVMNGLDGYPNVVPWTTLLVVGVGVPLLGVALVGLLTRSRLPMVRRLG
jgi:putative ABC transport system permease protein